MNVPAVAIVTAGSSRLWLTEQVHDNSMSMDVLGWKRGQRFAFGEKYIHVYACFYIYIYIYSYSSHIHIYIYDDIL